MPITATLPVDPPERGHALVDGHGAVTSAVSWGAIKADLLAARG